MHRVGIGTDSHRFEKGKKLILAGTEIEGCDGLKGNSDADVILHALFNALSQAVGERSLGTYSDDMCKNGITDSREYIKVALDMITKKGYKINNIGIMVEAGKPKLEPFHDAMKNSLSKILNLENDAIGITFTSGEDLTSFGRGEGIQAIAIVGLSNE
ncbi:MAG: 2-C-methyl-D-erythritol 2,4-cyclodiphosphate synthase [bacterium]|nr:2-C-methyl-D-erythritol 2,4-cyclodiphosphate synthase [bacterium]